MFFNEIASTIEWLD